MKSVNKRDRKIVNAIIWFLEQTPYTNHDLVWKSEAISWLKKLIEDN